VENRGLIHKIEVRSVRGAPEPRDFFRQIFLSPFEKERDHYMAKIVAHQRQHGSPLCRRPAVRRRPSVRRSSKESPPPAADQEEVVEEEEAAGAQGLAATQGEEKKIEETADAQPLAVNRKEESSSTRKMTIAEKIAASAAAAKKNE